MQQLGELAQSVNASQPLKHPCKKPGTVALGAVTVLRRVPQPASYSNRQAPGSVRDLASNNKVEKILKRVSDVSLWPLNVHISEHTFLHTHVCTHTHRERLEQPTPTKPSQQVLELTLAFRELMKSVL